MARVVARQGASEAVRAADVMRTELVARGLVEVRQGALVAWLLTNSAHVETHEMPEDNERTSPRCFVPAYEAALSEVAHLVDSQRATLSVLARAGLDACTERAMLRDAILSTARMGGPEAVRDLLLHDQGVVWVLAAFCARQASRIGALQSKLEEAQEALQESTDRQADLMRKLAESNQTVRFVERPEGRAHK